MLRCEDVQKELEAFLRNEVDEQQRSRMHGHLEDCQNCSQALRQLTRLSEVLQSWQDPEPSPLMYEKLKSRMRSHESSRGGALVNSLVRKVAFHLTEVAAVVALTLSVSHWFGRPAPEIQDESATINLYFREHQNVIARTASLTGSPQEPARVHVDRHDILYYEFLDDPYEFARPGIIVRGPSSRRQVIRPEAPAISNGHTLTLSEARKTVNFDLVSPPRLHPGYMLDQIRSIEGRDALHLLYTDGINTVSLFEQSLEAERGLVAQDFREYAVYRNKQQAGGTILAWRHGPLSYVLIGNAEMSQLMDMAQSINAGNERE
ncbi:MAG: anti-sigma factor family protein [Planctomycetota bacterium]|jgi:hypothetical protein